MEGEERKGMNNEAKVNSASGAVKLGQNTTIKIVNATASYDTTNNKHLLLAGVGRCKLLQEGKTQ